MKQYYEEEHAKEGSYLAVEFEAQNEEEKKIELNIPFSEGVVHNDWKLLPLVPPIVSACMQTFNITTGKQATCCIDKDD